MESIQDRQQQQCASCGAVIELAETDVSGTCSYCTSQLVDVASSAAVVDRVAPFRLPKRAALDRLRQHLAARFWAPESLRKLAARGDVHATMRGVLVPFYAYDARCRSTYAAQVGVHWHRTETFKDKEGNKKTRQVQETEWFPLQGSAVEDLRGHLESASMGLPPSEVVGLGAFDLGRALKFDPHLLAGWGAELPSHARAQVDRNAVEHIRVMQARRIKRRLLPGDTSRSVSIKTETELLAVELLLLPVWVTTYQHAGKVYRLLVHGQSGRCHGEVPVSRAKVVTAALLVAVLGVIALYLWGVYR